MNLGVPKGKQGSVEYAAYVSELGWQNKVENGEIAGTVGRAKSVEAFKMNLTGEIADEYDIYYRAHSSGFGWLGWAKNGEYAGKCRLCKSGRSSRNQTVRKKMWQRNHNRIRRVIWLKQIKVELYIRPICRMEAG